MNIGLLVLRLTIALILAAHAAQKTFGWFGGRGLKGHALLFEHIGVRPGLPLVIVASLTEGLAAVSLAAGLLTPLGCTAAFATMCVAGYTMHHGSKSFWNAAGGGEYPYFIGAIAAAVAFTGPGDLSVDHLLLRLSPALVALDGGVIVGAAVVAVGILASLPFVIAIRRPPATS
jgi:putative oxidoreductase